MHVRRLHRSRTAMSSVVASLGLALGACGGGTVTSAAPTAPPTTPVTSAVPETTIAAEPLTSAKQSTSDRWTADGSAHRSAPASTAPQVVVADRLPEFTHEAPLDDVVATALVDLDTYWSQVMPELYGEPWKPISGGFYPYTSSSDLPPCPGVREYADIAQNAFYCPGGDLVAWDDEALMPDLQSQYGNFTLAIVIAHEMGHAVQTRSAFPATLTVTKEQQADCFAGGWVASVANGHSANFDVTLADLDEAVAGFLLLRDQPGSSAREAGAHGSAFDRIGSFQDGFENGARACSAYTDDSVSARLVQVPFTSESDAASGGNLPWDSVLPVVSADLESFWSAVFTQYGATWTPIDPTERADGVLAKRLYDEIGDFAAATLLGRAYASFVQERLDEPGTELQRSLQADCLTGTWAASMFLADRPDASLRMSPGDLDKAVMALLVSGDSAESVSNGTATIGSPFQRVEALRTGFMDGIAACAKITES